MTRIPTMVATSVFLLFAAGCSAARPTPARFVGGEQVTVQVEGQGVVTSPSGEVRCRAGSADGCGVDWTASGRGLLSARPAPGWRFAGWQVANANPGFLAPMGEKSTRVYRARFVRDYQRPPSVKPAEGPREVASAGPPASNR